jgi:hypothetical protein
MRILLFDLETTPLQVFAWGRGKYDTAIDVVKDWELLSVSYQWYGDPEITCLTRKNRKSDKKLTRQLWQLFDKADVVVAHNAKGFDVPKARAKFIEHGLRPYSPVKVFDTLEAARTAKFSSHRLNEIGKLLNLGKKIKTDFELWTGCIANNPEAWRKMTEYNIRDVKLLADWYTIIRPWVAHPSVLRNGLVGCPACASLRLKSRGWWKTATGSYRRYYCLDCGKPCRDSKVKKGSAKALITGL